MLQPIDLEPAMAPPESEVFLEGTKVILNAMGVQTATSFEQFNPVILAEQGHNHLITDRDGVLAPWREKIPDETLLRLEWFGEELEHGVSIVSGNWALEEDNLPPNVRFSRPRSWNQVKPLKTLANQALKTTGAKAAETMGIGDGLADAIALRSAHLAQVVIVESSGPHIIEQLVRRGLYHPAMLLATGVLSAATDRGLYHSNRSR